MEQSEKILNKYVEELDGFVKNTSFKFKIYSNEGEYKKATHNPAPKTIDEANQITYYINGIAKLVSSELDGELPDFNDASPDSDIKALTQTFSASMQTSIEFLVPFPNIIKDLTNDNGEVIEEIKFSDLVCDIISDALHNGWSAEMKDGTETYLVGSRFSMPTPGLKDIRATADVSLPFTVFGEHFFVAQGVQSKNLVLKIGGKTVIASRVGFARQTIHEGNIFASSEIPLAKNTVSGTALTISFDAPLRIGGYNDSIISYVVVGGVDKLTVTVTMPVSETTAALGTITETYKMIIADAGINGELGVAASLSCRLVEVY
jgi:hypothetical protein